MVRHRHCGADATHSRQMIINSKGVTALELPACPFGRGRREGENGLGWSKEGLVMSE